MQPSIKVFPRASNLKKQKKESCNTIIAIQDKWVQRYVSIGVAKNVNVVLLVMMIGNRVVKL